MWTSPNFPTLALSNGTWFEGWLPIFITNELPSAYNKTSSVPKTKTTAHYSARACTKASRCGPMNRCLGCLAAQRTNRHDHPPFAPEIPLVRCARCRRMQSHFLLMHREFFRGRRETYQFPMNLLCAANSYAGRFFLTDFPMDTDLTTLRIKSGRNDNEITH